MKIKRLMHYGARCLALCGALLWGCCDKDKIKEDPEEPAVEVKLTTDPQELVFEAAGGSKSFAISCNGEWTIEGGNEWCQADVVSGKGDRTVTVSVQQYTGMEDRNTNLTVKSGDKTAVLGVTQKSKDAIILSKEKYDNVKQEGDTLAIEVKSNIEYSITIPEKYNWISPVQGTRAVTEKTYRFAVAANDNVEVRSGYIVFSGNSLKDTVRIYQAPENRLILLTRDTCDVTAAGDTLMVELRTNVNYEVTIPESVDWVKKIQPETRAVRTDRLIFSVSENESTEGRATAVIVKDRDSDLADTLHIIQCAKGVILLGKSEGEVAQAGGEIAVSVESNIKYEVTIPAEFQGWIAQAPATRAMTAKTYKFIISANDSTAERRGYVLFAGGGLSDTLHIRQARKECLLVEGKASHEVEVAAAGGTVTANVTANVEYEVKIPSGVDWISNQSSSAAQLTLTVSANTGTSPREANVTLISRSGNATATLKIKQAGKFVFGSSNIFTETVGGVSFTMVYVEKGEFTMGATSEQGDDAYDWEKPAHRVTLSDYYIGECVVTQELWQAVMGTTVEQQKAKATWDMGLVGVGSDYPMYYVSWEDAQEFCAKLSQLTGRTYALPTEAQWEFAARGGNKNKGNKYSGSNTIDNVAWYWDNSSSATHPVKRKQANDLGLYDMSGNVYEWCQDWYDSSYYSYSPSTDPTGPSSGSMRVLRGGSWGNDARKCRVSFRIDYAPGNRDGSIGFRLVLLP